jgi:hypothetical protein
MEIVWKTMIQSSEIKTGVFWDVDVV